MGSSPQSASVMLDLKEFFLETLATRIEALDEALAREVAPDSDDESTIRHIAHGIRGSGGTYGFPELSELGEKVELAPVAELRSSAFELLQELRRLTETASAIRSRVLLIEGVDEDAVALEEGLSASSRSVRRASTAAEANKALYEETFQLIVLDIVLPDLDGRSMLLRLREQFRTCEVPVLIVAGNVNARLQAECYQLGAMQVFEKPVAPEVLSAAAAAAIERAEHSNRVSTLDPLTGLPNRAGFHETLQRAVSMSARTGEPLSVAVIDLDRFKSINDTHGHLVGDEVLRRVASVLQKRTRKSDYVARWGGEEFVALFYGSGEEGATLGLERLRAGVKNELFRTADGAEFRVAFSAGVVVVDPDSGAAEAIADADRLLYQAKAGGRDRIVNSQSVVETARASVLLAEDDELVAEAVARTLAKHGYDVVHHADPQAALGAVESHEFVLGILDVNMPGMDGFELLSKLRRLPGCQEMPLIMLTGRGEERDVVHGFDLGADDYVVKPFSPPELAARVHRLARRR